MTDRFRISEKFKVDNHIGQTFSYENIPCPFCSKEEHITKADFMKRLNEAYCKVIKTNDNSWR